MDMHGETYRPETVASPTKKYSQLSTSEKAVWHADTYVWRLTHGHTTLAEIVGGKYSPTDPDGEWWRRVEGVVRQRFLLVEQDRERYSRRRDIAKDDLAAEGRELLNKWAVRRGYVNWDAAWDANMRPGMPPGFLQRVSEEVREMFPSKYMRQQPVEKPRPTRSELAERYGEPRWMEPEPTPEPGPTPGEEGMWPDDGEPFPEAEEVIF